MGLLNLFKTEPKKEYKKPSEKEMFESLAELNEKQGDVATAFYFRNKAAIDLYETQITDFLLEERNSKDQSKRLQSLYSAKSLFESFRNFCSSKQGGSAYFASFNLEGDKRGSRYERLLADIKKIEDK